MIYWRRAKRTRLHDSMRTISGSWYRASDELQCMHGFGTELIRNLAIWLAVSQDYHLFIYKVYWYILSMFVPIFTSFGIENASLHSGRPRKLLPLISLSYFFLFHDPRVSTRGIASISYWHVKTTATPVLHMAAVKSRLLRPRARADVIVCAKHPQSGDRSLYCIAFWILFVTGIGNLDGVGQFFTRRHSGTSCKYLLLR